MSDETPTKTVQAVIAELYGLPERPGTIRRPIQVTRLG